MVKRNHVTEKVRNHQFRVKAFWVTERLRYYHIDYIWFPILKVQKNYIPYLFFCQIQNGVRDAFNTTNIVEWEMTKSS